MDLLATIIYWCAGYVVIGCILGNLFVIGSEARGKKWNDQLKSAVILLVMIFWLPAIIVEFVAKLIKHIKFIFNKKK